MVFNGTYELELNDGVWHCCYIFALVCALAQALWDVADAFKHFWQSTVLDHFFFSSLKSRLCLLHLHTPLIPITYAYTNTGLAALGLVSAVVTIADELGLFDSLDAHLGTGHSPLQSRRLCGRVVFFATCTVLLFHAEAFLCVRRLAAAAQRWTAMQARWAQGKAPTTPAELRYFRAAAALAASQPQPQQPRTSSKTPADLSAALSRECGQQLTALIEVPWASIAVCLAVAWTTHSAVVALLGTRLGTAPLDHDLLVECASALLLVGALALLHWARRHQQEQKEQQQPMGALPVTLAQFCALVACVCATYVAARALAVLRVPATMHPDMRAPVYSFDRRAAWSYTTVGAYLALVLGCVLPRTMEALPLAAVLCAPRPHSKRD